jgi:Ribose/xylose/arabinose/galactoside ABC-type transport systems, permease components
MVGTVNALLVVKRKVPAFVATFGMLMVLEGARLLWTRGSISSEVPQEFVQIARGTVGPVPIPVIFWVLLTALAVFWVRKTASGRQLVLSGASPRMAGLSGIALGRNQWISFLAAAVLAVIGGVLLAGHAGYIDRATGQGLELDSITAAILGGARFIGGEGSYVGAALGALLLGVISTALVVLALPPELQNIIKGVVLLVALALHRMVAR